MPFTDSVRPRHTPETPSTCAEPPSMPSEPTSRATRVTSAANVASWSTIVLIVSLQREELADRLDVDLLREVALRDRGRHVCGVAHLIGQVPHHQVHVVGQAAPDAGDARHLGLAAEPAFDADLAGDAGDLVGERRELVDHRVDRVGELCDLALRLHGDLAARGRRVATAVVTSAMFRT